MKVMTEEEAVNHLQRRQTEEKLCDTIKLWCILVSCCLVTVYIIVMAIMIHVHIHD